LLHFFSFHAHRQLLSLIFRSHFSNKPRVSLTTLPSTPSPSSTSFQLAWLPLSRFPAISLKTPVFAPLILAIRNSTPLFIFDMYFHIGYISTNCSSVLQRDNIRYPYLYTKQTHIKSAWYYNDGHASWWGQENEGWGSS
jgi:hypothetical protein